LAQLCRSTFFQSGESASTALTGGELAGKRSEYFFAFNADHHMRLLVICQFQAGTCDIKESGGVDMLFVHFICSSMSFLAPAIEEEI
jgi:hypothetical protein